MFALRYSFVVVVVVVVVVVMVVVMVVEVVRAMVVVVVVGWRFNRFRSRFQVQFRLLKQLALLFQHGKGVWCKEQSQKHGKGGWCKEQSQKLGQQAAGLAAGLCQGHSQGTQLSL